jgi:hypothetical protein
MRAIVISLVLGLSALGTLFSPSKAQAQPVPGFYAGRGPAPYWRGGSHYRWRGGSHYRHIRPGYFGPVVGPRPLLGPAISAYAPVNPYPPVYPSLGAYGGYGTYPGGVGGYGYGNGYGNGYNPYYP